MSIVDHIRREHDEIVELFAKLMALARDPRKADEAVRTSARLVAQVRVHSRAEERVFYEALHAHSGPLKAFALAAPYEHENVDTTLEKLLDHRPGNDEYELIVKVARDLFVMHARDEEEADILPLVVKTLTPKELTTLTSDMLAEETRIRPTILRLVGMPAQAA